MEKDNLSHIPYVPQPYALEEPKGFVPMDIPADNPMTVEGTALGKRLFFDPILSVDSSLSCSGCHLPSLAFADSMALSRGAGEERGQRNAPSLLNVGYFYTGLFWDGRVRTLEEQALFPVTHPREMACNWDEVEHRLRRHRDYPAAFRRAFGIRAGREISRDLVCKALAQYERTLISADARFDRVQRKEEQFTASERRGWEIFFDFPGGLPQAECGHCHTDPLFTDLEYFNNGLAGSMTGDPGRAAATGRPSDTGKFRTPSLRNVALTAPYMHDGRFGSLEEVVDHYAMGGHFADNVNPNVRPLRLGRRDKADLIAFLHTLTDRAYLDRSTID